MPRGQYLQYLENQAIKCVWFEVYVLYGAFYNKMEHACVVHGRVRSVGSVK